MSKKVPIRELDSIIRRFGVRCHATVRGFGTVPFFAFVQDFVSRDNRRYRSRFETVATLAGVSSPNSLVVYARYDDFWDTDDEIRILYHGKQYTVTYDSVMWFGDTPSYVWALMEPVSAVKDDYGDFDEGVEDVGGDV